VKARSAVLAAWLMTACGGEGARPAPKSIEPQRSGGEADTLSEESEPGTPGGGASQPGYGQSATPAGPFAQEPPLTLEEAQSALDSAATELSTAGQSCAQACKALASMKRSSDRICELNGPSDPGARCQKARDRVETARETMRKRCGSCE
jgi:hypothetical protein